MKQQMCGRFLNLKAFHQLDLYCSHEERVITLSELSRILPPSIAQLELSTDKYLEIPKEVQKIYSTYRPTPLIRARKLEQALASNCEIYLKDEGASPSGNHKTNSAYLIAYLCKKDGFKAITTETTGNWGIALSMAGKEFGIKVICFLDEESHSERPDRKPAMEKYGAEVVLVKPDNFCTLKDPLTHSADAAIDYTRKTERVCYIFGSVYNYFIIPQSMVGIEIKNQLSEQEKYPDIVVGTCGGGASLLGTASVFLADTIDNGRGTRIVSAEANTCPILSEGKYGLYSIDSNKYYPLLKTYGIESLKEGEYIGGIGSTVLASSVAFCHSKGLIEVNQFSVEDAKKAAQLFYTTEGNRIALETGFTMAAIIKQAQENDGKIIVANISSGERDKQFYT